VLTDLPKASPFFQRSASEPHHSASAHYQSSNMPMTKYAYSKMTDRRSRSAFNKAWAEAYEEKAWREAHFEYAWREALKENALRDEASAKKMAGALRNKEKRRRSTFNKAWREAHEEKAVRERTWLEVWEEAHVADETWEAQLQSKAVFKKFEKAWEEAHAEKERREKSEVKGTAGLILPMRQVSGG